MLLGELTLAGVARVSLSQDSVAVTWHNLNKISLVSAFTILLFHMRFINQQFITFEPICHCEGFFESLIFLLILDVDESVTFTEFQRIKDSRS